MNVESYIKTSKKLPLGRKTIIHLMLISNTIKEAITIALKPFGISIQQYNVLRILRGQNEVPANLYTLNERMIHKMSNTTRLVDKLVSKKYVKRTICKSNRRKVEIIITTEGLSALKNMEKEVTETEHELVVNFEKEDLEYLNTLLNKF